jgi:hypothetical protein
MAVTLKISSTLRALVPGYDPLAGMELDPQPGDRVADILARIGIPRLGLFPPVGGG